MIINVLLTLHSYNENCTNEYIIKNNNNSWVASAGWEEAEDNRRIGLITDILPWLWQRPWKMLTGKKSPWRFMKAIPYYYFAERFLPLNKPWGPFWFPEGPRIWNLTLNCEELKRKWCFTTLWRRWAISRSICWEALQLCYLAQQSPVHFKIPLTLKTAMLQVLVSKYLHFILLTKHRIMDQHLYRAERDTVMRGGKNTEMFGFTPC